VLQFSLLDALQHSLVRTFHFDHFVYPFGMFTYVGFLKWGYPKTDGFLKIMVNPIKMDDLGVPPFSRTCISPFIPQTSPKDGYLVGGLEHVLFFHSVGNNNPN